jgi:hypothetical protein
MRSWVLAAGLLAAAVTTGAQAADLYDGPPPDRYGSAYEDPRYADIYKYPTPPPYPYAVPPRPYAGVPVPPPYAGPPIPRERVYRDEDDNGYEPKYFPGPRRHSYADPRGPYAGRCVPKELIKDELLRRGWHDFHYGEAHGDVATVRARRPSGRLFALTIDRCSGEIVNAEALEPRRFGPFAYGPPPRRWDRAY